jgi:hypothetical protein
MSIRVRILLAVASCAACGGLAQIPANHKVQPAKICDSVNNCLE